MGKIQGMAKVCPSMDQAEMFRKCFLIDGVLRACQFQSSVAAVVLLWVDFGDLGNWILVWRALSAIAGGA